MKPVKKISQEEKTYAAVLHLSQIVGSWLFALGSIFLPLVLWLIKKDESKFIDENGKEVLNFQLSLYIYFIILIILSVVTLGLLLIVLLPLLLVFEFIIILFAVIGAIRAADGKIYRYPLNLRLIK